MINFFLCEKREHLPLIAKEAKLPGWLQLAVYFALTVLGFLRAEQSSCSECQVLLPLYTPVLADTPDPLCITQLRCNLERLRRIKHTGSGVSAATRGHKHLLFGVDREHLPVHLQLLSHYGQDAPRGRRAAPNNKCLCPRWSEATPGLYLSLVTKGVAFLLLLAKKKRRDLRFDLFLFKNKEKKGFLS